MRHSSNRVNGTIELVRVGENQPPDEAASVQEVRGACAKLAAARAHTTDHLGNGVGSPAAVKTRTAVH